MSGTLFKGSKTPNGLPRAVRRKFDEYDEALARWKKQGSSGAPAALTTGAPISSSGPVAKANARIPVIYQNISTVGTITQIPLEAPGTLLVARLADGATFAGGGNLVLTGDLVGGPGAELVLLVSDGSVWREVSRSQSGYQLWVPARIWGAIPDTGLDMTAEIQDALDSCPVGATLYFEPGTYVLSAAVDLVQAINVYAYGATWDWGATNLGSGAGFTVGDLTSTQIRQVLVAGLTMVRTYTYDLDNAVAGPGTGIAYIGFQVIACNRCTFRDLEVEGFSRGYYFIGRNGVTGAGCAENVIDGCRALNNRYSLTLEQSGADAFVNENDFYNFEHQHSTSFSAANCNNATYGIEMCRLLWAAVANRPNNNRFWGCNWEAPSTRPAYRKVRVEGSENGWYHCRWETHDTIDITVGKAATVNTFMTRNLFFHGMEMNTIIDNSLIEFVGTTAANNKNQFFSGWSSIWAGGNNEPAISIYGGGDTTDLIELKKVTGSAEKTILMRAGGPSSEHGYIGFYDNSTTQRNYLSLATSALNSIWDIKVDQGLEIGGKGQFYASGNNLQLFPITSGGTILAVGNSGSDTPVLGAKNGASGNRSFGIYDSSGNLVVAVAASGSSQAGPFTWYTSSTERNRISLESGSPYKLQVHNGLRLNAADTTSGDVVWLDGSGTPSEGFKLNATTQRVQVGGITPASTDGKLVTASLKIAGRLDINVTSSGSSPVSVSVEDCYIGLTAATITVNLPAVANVSDGHTIIIKDESGSGGHTIDGSGAETIDGAATQPLGAYASMTLVKRNSAWWIT